MLEFGEWLPDQAAYASAGASDAKGVIPLTTSSYGPLNGLSTVIDAQPEQQFGAAALRESDGTINVFCGDADDLYILTTTVFDEISSSTGAYTTAAGDFIDIIQYGDRCITVNGHTDNPQTYLMGTDSVFSDLGGTPPQAQCAAVINNFVMLGNLDVGGTVTPNAVQWCAIDDPTDWPTLGSADAAAKQSDSQNLAEGWDVQRIVGAVGGADGAVFMRNAVYRVTYVGSPLVMSFQVVEKSRDTIAPRSVINVGAQAFFIAEDGFYSFDGTQSVGIGAQKVDQYFLDDLDWNYLYNISAAADPVNKIVMWTYPGVGNLDGFPNRQIMYNWQTGRWSRAEESVATIYNNLAVGYSLDQLDTFGTLDSLTTSLDDRSWIGGLKTLAGFSSTHRLSTFTGAPVAATVCTTEFGGNELFQKPNERLYVDGIRPHVDGGTVTVSLEYRDSPQGTLSTDGPTVVDTNGMAGFTRSCRYARATVDIAAGSTWSHAQGVDIDASEDGEF